MQKPTHSSIQRQYSTPYRVQSSPPYIVASAPSALASEALRGAGTRGRMAQWHWSWDLESGRAWNERESNEHGKYLQPLRSSIYSTLVWFYLSTPRYNSSIGGKAKRSLVLVAVRLAGWESWERAVRAVSPHTARSESREAWTKEWIDR